MPRPLAAPLLLALILAACGGGESPSTGTSTPPPPPPVTGTVPASVAIVTGNDQSTAPSSPLATLPAVLVKDANGRPVPGALVTFAVAAGGGRIATDTTRTGTDGTATAGPWTLGPLPGANRLQATVAALAPVEFTATARYGVATAPVTGSVALGSGTSLDLATLRVASGLADVPVGANGQFTASIEPGGTQFAVVQAPNGQPIFFAWLDETHRSFSVRTTAEVMAYFDLGGYFVTRYADRNVVRDYLRTVDMTGLMTAITAAIKAPPGEVTLATTAIRDARRALVLTLRSAAAHAPIANGTIVNPAATEKSGVVVDAVGLQNVLITNHRRRRAVAFVDRVSYIPKGMHDSVVSPALGQPVNLSAVGSATSVIGTGVDILFGKMAWAPVSADPQPVPLFPADAVATHYTVTVVGPGTRNAAITLTPLQQAEQRRAAFETFIIEGLLPLLDQALSVDNALQDAGGGSPFGNLVQVTIDLMPAGVLESAVAGDMQGALIGAWKVLQDSGKGQEILLNAWFTAIASKGVPKEVILGKAKQWLKALTVVEVLATAGDLYAVTDHSATALDAESWEVNVAEAKVQLTPEVAFISNLDIQTFTARVLDVTDGGPAPVFHYRWSTTGNFGKICAQFAGCSTSIPSSSRDEISYAPDVLKEGTDQISVDVFFVEAGREHLVGQAKAAITTYAAKVTVAPQNSSIKVNQQVTLTATVDTKLQDGGVLNYTWTTPGTFGNFLGGQTSISGTSRTVTYTASKGTEGSEPITVVASSTKNGVTHNLGTAQATVLIEKDKPTIVMGSWVIDPPASIGTGRQCVAAWITFPLVAGAKSYDVHAYGFNDTAHWGRDIEFSVSSFNQTWLPCSVGTSGVTGVNGSEYRFFLTGGGGPVASIPSFLSSYAARFAGMVVEVTVHY